MDATQAQPATDPSEDVTVRADRARAAAVKSAESRSQALHLKRFELLHGQMPSTILGWLTTGVLVIVLLRALDSTSPLLTWFAFLVAISLVRVWQVVRYRHTKQANARIEPWRRAFTLSNFVVGCVWGSVMMVPDLRDIRQAAALIVVLGGIMGTSSVLYAVSFRAFLAFTLPIMAAMLAVVSTHPALVSFVPFLFAYDAAVIVGARRNARALSESLSAQLENVDLLSDLQSERDRYFDLNAALEVRVAERTNELSASNAMLQQEIAEKDRVQRRLMYQASHDALTLLANRTEFESRLQQVVSDRRRSRHPHAVCCMDLDQFKLVNDTCGHGAGDELLRRLSGMMAAHVRAGDVLARLGGDEFGILLYDAGLNESMQLIERLRDMIENFTFLWDRRQFKVTASFGVAIVTDDYDSVTDILRDADTACFLAKDRGRNCVHVHVQEDATVSERRQQMAWINRLDAAMGDGRLLLSRQPIVHSEGRGAPHWEILLRLRDEDGDIITPGLFLPAAERFGMMPRLDRFVVERVTDYLAADKDGVDCYAINLSGASLGDERLIAFLHERVKGCPNPARLCFEITETSAISNLTQVREIIGELRGLGCQFSLDDFGTGMASFDYLRSLPVDFLKIDGSFIKDIADNPISLAMVRAVNDIAHLMGMRTVAEFVENHDIATVLRGIGIDYLQGYAFGRPHFFMPGDYVEEDVHSIKTVQFVVNG